MEKLLKKPDFYKFKSSGDCTVHINFSEFILKNDWHVMQ